MKKTKYLVLISSPTKEEKIKEWYRLLDDKGDIKILSYTPFVLSNEIKISRGLKLLLKYSNQFTKNKPFSFKNILNLPRLPFSIQNEFQSYYKTISEKINIKEKDLELSLLRVRL